MPLERMGEKSAENLVRGIEESKTRGLSRFLFGLGIPDVGAHVARVLARHYGSLDAIRAASEEDLTAVREVGPVIASSVVQFFTRPENARLLERLRQAGVVMEEEGGGGGRARLGGRAPVGRDDRGGDGHARALHARGDRAARSRSWAGAPRRA